MYKIATTSSGATSVKEVLTYADQIRIINWQAHQYIAVKQHIEAVLASAMSVPVSDSPGVRAVLKEAGIKPYDLVSVGVAAGGCSPDEQAYICKLHVPTAKELNKAVDWLGKEAAKLYRLKEMAVRRLNPHVKGAVEIRGRFFIVADVEELYKPHIPANQTEIQLIKDGRYHIISSDESNSQDKPYLMEHISRVVVAKAISSLQRLVSDSSCLL